MRSLLTAACALSVLLAQVSLAADEPPKEWIDPDTGHRVVRLSTEPETASLYFHQNGYSPDGSKLIVTTPHGLSTIDLQSRENKQIVKGEVRVIVTGRKSGNVYYLKSAEKGAKEQWVYATHMTTLKTRKIAKIPKGNIVSVNADETLLLGSWVDGEEKSLAPPPSAPIGPDGRPLNYHQTRGAQIQAIFEQRLPRTMFTVNVANGELKVIRQSNDWLNHLQFSPTDPNLIMFCHEGPWHEVDRIWTIRTDGTGLTKIHTRTMHMEIAGHEFFSPDGETIWYDLQTPRGEVFWLAGYHMPTGQRTWYQLQRNEWSIHFNSSRDGTLFAGDGGDEAQVARAKDGMWIYLFRPELVPNLATGPVSKEPLIRSGVLRAEKLVKMSAHKYKLEPNVSFTPDQKWVVFRLNMHGPTHTYAVEVSKANGQEASAP
jgi:oligogalacturonide lyase